MIPNALDLATDTTGRAHELAAAFKAKYGVDLEAVGFYARADRASKSMIDGWHSMGVKVFTIWEKGNPTAPGYFTVEQAKTDADAAIAFAKLVGQPANSTISTTFDFESTWDEVRDYAETFHDLLRAENLFSLPYGDWATIQAAMAAGYAVQGFLSESTGFPGHAQGVGEAAIVQLDSLTLGGFDVDTDFVRLTSVDTAAGAVSVVW